MVRKAIVVFMFVFGLATVAQAEHKLLPTDILDAKQVEGMASIGYTYDRGDFTLRSGTGSTYRNNLFSNFSVGAGLGHGLQVTASLPYMYTNDTKADYNYNRASTYYNRGSGFGGFSLAGKYLVLDEKKYPFTLAVGLGVKFDTAGTNTSTDSTDYKPLLTASKRFGDFIPYVSYSANIKSNNDYQDSHTFLVGSEIKLNQNISLVPEFSASAYRESRTWSSFEEYSFTLSSFIQAYRNFYVIPSVGISKATDNFYKISFQKNDNNLALGAGLAVYYLW